MIKIYSGDKTVHLTDNYKELKEGEGFQTMAFFILKGGHFEKEYHSAINEKKEKEIYIWHGDIKALFNHYKSMFRFIEAAGGLVKNENDEYLFIFRNGKWDLPKGKREMGETIKKCALREVKEECGIKGLKIVKELPSTFHTYYMEEKAVLKQTFWFEMECKSSSDLIPQTEEGITEVKWVKKKDFKKILANTYPSIKDVMEFC